jgi:hypothetical protein
MSVPRKWAFAGAALALSVAGALPAEAATASTGKLNCFFTSQWKGWKAPAPDVLYLGVSIHDVYRVGLAHPSSLLQDPTARLVSVTRGPSSICLPIDLQMDVTNFYGVSEHLYPASLVKLTPEEVKAIPPKYIPY